MICEGCACSESRPCLDEETGEPCSWVKPGLCSACALNELLDGKELSFGTTADGGPAYRERLFPRQVT